MKVLVGSQAIKHHFPDFREPKDWDYFSNSKIAGAEVFYHPALENWQWGDVATADEMYTIKVSHAFWPNRWPKHIQDIAWMQNKGCKRIPELHDILYAIWSAHYGKKRASLKKGTTADEFFTSTIERVYDHDSLHDSVAYYHRPLFNEILADGESVAVDKDKFDALSYEDKIRLVREEVYATALERVMIPSQYKKPSLMAYRYALCKTITSFSKGWFPLWAVENIADLLVPDIDYVQRHHDNSNKLILLKEQ